MPFRRSIPAPVPGPVSAQLVSQVPLAGASSGISSGALAGAALPRAARAPLGPRRRPRLRRRLRAGLILACLALVLLAAWPLWLQWRGNFHTVLPGVLYRSAQPDAALLRRAVTEDHLRSVLNLRGAHPDEAWYREETGAAAALGLVHVDFGLSAEKAPSPERIAALIATLRSLPQPVLIHCRSGADRTGLAAAIYLAAIAGRSPAEAGGQLAFAYGHVGLPGLSAASAMDATWASIVPGLRGSLSAPLQVAQR